MFGGHASSAFLYFEDLWRYDWPQRAWTEIVLPNTSARPETRYGHTAVWDAESKSMLILAGRFLSIFYDDIWQFNTQDSGWRHMQARLPTARAYHTTILDPADGALLLFGGESSSHVLGDLQRFSLVEAKWSRSSAPGPAARSHHTAVWAGSARAMLVFAGWSGEKYLQDLHRYDATADRWTELPAAGSWPAARGGHAACWDPISESMLVMGGIQNVSSSLSYDASLYNYSLLIGSFQEEGLQAMTPGPTGRTGHAVIWDSDSRGLLSFSGFNSSYLGQTWRYAVRQTRPASAVTCQLGHACAFSFSNVSGLVAVKRSCSDSEFLAVPVKEEEDVWKFGPASLLALEPGHHRLCRCETNCSRPEDFQIALGFFMVQGPYVNQSAQCQLGSVCTIPAWRGFGVSVNDSLVMKKQCATGTGPLQRSVGVSFNDSHGFYTLHVGYLDPDPEGQGQGLKPEAAEICWCPAGSLCTEEDFGVLALRLDIVCPPGEYSDGAGSGCLPCPADSFCPGGLAFQSCPHASTSQVGSSPLPRLCAVSPCLTPAAPNKQRVLCYLGKLSDCQCLQGRYWAAETCLACPAGSSTLQAGPGLAGWCSSSSICC